ncbi:MAG: hypothetical protein J1E29_04285 [Duncaniella sp.]|nr:hypothetical protein [Duncaniella sp.]
MKRNLTAHTIILILLSLLQVGQLSAQSIATTTTKSASLIIPEGVDTVTTVTTFITHTTYHRPASEVKRDTVYVYLPAPERVDTVVKVVEVTADGGCVTCADSMVSPTLYTDSLNGYPLNERGKMVLATIDPALLGQRVVVGADTIPIILPAPNYGRYDRGLFNFLFIPKGQWMFGLTASYGEFNSDDIQVLSLIKDFNFKGKMYSVQPSFSYFFRNNQSVGMKFVYSHAGADLGGLAVDFDDDMSFRLSDVSYYSHSYTVSAAYRNYVGLGSDKRFAIFNEVDLAFGSGASRFLRSYDGEPRDTKTLTTKWSLNFSPGVTMFIMDNVCFNVSFGVFGIHATHEKQYTNGLDEGRRTSSGANFKFNLFNINFGLGVCI